MGSPLTQCSTGRKRQAPSSPGGQLQRARGQHEGWREEEELVACDTRTWGCAVVRHELQGGDRGGNTRGGGSS